MKVNLVKDGALKSTKSQSLIEILIKDGWKVIDDIKEEVSEVIEEVKVKRGRPAKGE